MLLLLLPRTVVKICTFAKVSGLFINPSLYTYFTVLPDIRPFRQPDFRCIPRSGDFHYRYCLFWGLVFRNRCGICLLLLPGPFPAISNRALSAVNVGSVTVTIKLAVIYGAFDCSYSTGTAGGLVFCYCWRPCLQVILWSLSAVTSVAFVCNYSIGVCLQLLLGSVYAATAGACVSSYCCGLVCCYCWGLSLQLIVTAVTFVCNYSIGVCLQILLGL